MHELQPYAPPESLPEHVSDEISTSSIWLGYLLAPPVAPIVAAALLLPAGFLLSDPSDTGTPIGLVLAPILVLIGGGFLSYVLGLVIFIPVAFLLRSKNRLTFANLCWTGAVVACALGVGLIILTMPTGKARPNSFLEVVISMCMASSVIAIFILINLSVFWLIAVRSKRQSQQENPPVSAPIREL